MKTKFVITALALACVAMAGCSRSDAPVAPNSKEAIEKAAQNSFDEPALPSVYENAEYRELALAADVPAQALIKLAKDTQDLEALTPSIEAFLRARDEFLTRIPDHKVRMSAFQNFMHKNLQSPEDRKAYAQAMNVYYKAKKASGTSRTNRASTGSPVSGPPAK
jgi:PBP1b-binding outer membrane lipoprotein LpoB